MYGIQCAGETTAVVARQVKCTKCNIYLCMVADHNCFYEFHSNLEQVDNDCVVSWWTWTLWNIVFLEILFKRDVTQQVQHSLV